MRYQESKGEEERVSAVETQEETEKRERREKIESE